MKAFHDPSMIKQITVIHDVIRKSSFYIQTHVAVGMNFVLQLITFLSKNHQKKNQFIQSWGQNKIGKLKAILSFFF